MLKQIGSSIQARIPGRGEIVSVFGVVIFVVHSWSVRGFLFRLPSLLLAVRTASLVVIFCYHMAFAFIESALVMAGLMGLAALLPPAWLRRGFVYKGSLVVLLAAIAAIILQESSAYEIFVFNAKMDSKLVAMLVVALIAAALLFLVVSRAHGARQFIEALADRISVMLFVYLPLDAAGMLVVAARLIRR